MSKTISEIYEKYKIMPNLQAHMLRVTAVASLICDSYDEQLPKEEIVTACLLHDMGNIIKSRLDYFPEFLEPQGMEYWQKVQNEYIERYGKDEHHATLEIMKEINVSQDIIALVDNIEFSQVCELCDNGDIPNKIICYSDNRVSPHGVVSLVERIDEAKKRYENKESFKRTESERVKLVFCIKEIEKQIFAKCKIKPEDINNESIAPVISELSNYVIHSI